MKKAVSAGKRLRAADRLNAPYAGITQVRFNGYDLRREPPPRLDLQEKLPDKSYAVKRLSGSLFGVARGEQRGVNLFQAAKAF
jgi:hypothetical protein